MKEGKGLVKFYNDIGGLEFEGEYLNGLRNGKEYDYDGKLYLKVNILMDLVMEKEKNIIMMVN